MKTSVRGHNLYLLDYQVYVTVDLTDAVTHFTDPGNYRSHWLIPGIITSNRTN